jgi:hypothetical protein
MSQQISLYLDINSQYDGRTSTAVLLEDELAVLNSLMNIMNTTRGERVFQPSIGTDLVRLLFEPISDNTAFLIELEIAHAAAFEPRCSLSRGSTQVIPDYQNECYRVDIAVQIMGMDSETVFPLVLKRG